MYIVISCSVLALFLTYLEAKGKLKEGMKWAFILMSIISAIHYDYGNDYMTYLELYNNIVAAPFNLPEVMSKSVFRDPGWAILCYIFNIFGKYGFFVLVAFIGIFENIVFYKSIRTYLPQRSWALGTFLYLFNVNLFLLNFSMLRQGFVIAIFLAIWPLVKERKWLMSLIIILISSTIHKSGMLLLPFSFWGYFPLKNGKTTVFFFVCICLALLFSSTLLENIFSATMSLSEDFEYMGEKHADNVALGIGNLYLLLPFVAYLSYIYADTNLENKRSVLLASIAIVMTPFLSLMPLASRIIMYFEAYSVIALPIAITAIRNKIAKTIIETVYIGCLIIFYVRFFYSDTWHDAYADFHTIFPQIFN